MNRRNPHAMKASANLPIFVKTARKKENRTTFDTNVVVSSSMIMNPTPGDSESVKSECLKIYVNGMSFPAINESREFITPR